MRNLKFWRVLAFCGSLAFIAAILFPVFAQAHSYSGPGMGLYRIASMIDRFHQDSGRWPTSFKEIQPLLQRRNRWSNYTVSFLALETKPDSADYVVTVNGSLGRYKTLNGRLTDVKAPVISGTLPVVKP